MIKNTTGLKFLMGNGSTTPAKLPITAATSTRPVVVSLVSTAGMKDGQLVTMSGTGMPSIDGKTFIIETLVADTSIALVGSDGTADTPATSGEATFYDDTIDMISLCAAEINPKIETSSPVPTPHFCDPTASVPGPAAPSPSYDVTMWLDTSDKGYCALIAARDDGKERMFKIEFPGNGALTFAGIVSSVGISIIPMEGSPTVAVQIVTSSTPIHRFNCV